MEIDRTRETVLIMRTTHVSMRSYNGFAWKRKGYVEAPDWEPDLWCGNGLHGFLYGVGDGYLANFGDDAYYTMVLETYKDVVVNLGDKVKFPFCWVIYCGDQATAAEIVKSRYPMRPVNCSKHVVGDYGSAITGFRGTSISGNSGTSLVGDLGTAVVGDCGKLQAGANCEVTAGSFCTVYAGYDSDVTAEHYSTISVEYRCRVTVGSYSKIRMRGEGVVTLGEGSVVVLPQPLGREIVYKAGLDLQVGKTYKIDHNASIIKL